MRYIKSKSSISKNLNKYLARNNMNFIEFAKEFCTPYKAGYITAMSLYKPRWAKNNLIDSINDDCKSDMDLCKGWNEVLRG